MLPTAEQILSSTRTRGERLLLLALLAQPRDRLGWSTCSLSELQLAAGLRLQAVLVALAGLEDARMVTVDRGRKGVLGRNLPNRYRISERRF